jgi:hypothetical protein
MMSTLGHSWSVSMAPALRIECVPVASATAHSEAPVASVTPVLTDLIGAQLPMSSGQSARPVYVSET